LFNLFKDYNAGKPGGLDAAIGLKLSATLDPLNPPEMFLGFLEFIVFIELLPATGIQPSTRPGSINTTNPRNPKSTMNTISLGPVFHPLPP